MSSPTPPPAPRVPYGPPATSPGTAEPLAVPPAMTIDLRGHPAVKWGLRALLPIVLRLVFRALFRR